MNGGVESKQEESRWHLFVWLDEALKEVFICLFIQSLLICCSLIRGNVEQVSFSDGFGLSLKIRCSAKSQSFKPYNGIRGGEALATTSLVIGQSQREPG